MPYASNTDVALEFKNIDFSSSGAVKAATVDGWCTQASQLIDGYLSGKYSTPVVSGTSPNSYSILQMLCIQMVAYRVKKVTASSTGDQKSTQGANPDAVWPKDVIDQLKAIQAGSVKLSDAVLASSADGAESYTNDNSATLQPPTFTRDGDDW